MSSVVYNMDCLEAMKQMPDNAFDLAVVDPPYGDAMGVVANRFGERFDRYKYSEGGGGTARRSTTARHYAFGSRKSSRNYQNRRNMGGEIRKKIIAWDVAPEKEYFDQLFRVSRNQIIWGAITSTFLRQDASSSSGRQTFQKRDSAWLRWSMRGRPLTGTQKS